MKVNGLPLNPIVFALVLLASTLFALAGCGPRMATLGSSAAKLADLSAAQPVLVFKNSPVTMTAGRCSTALTVQLQDGNGKPIPGSQNTVDVSITVGFDTDVISGQYGSPVAYSDSACSVPLLPTASSPKGSVPNGGYVGTGIATIPAGHNSVNVYMIPKTSVFMNLITTDQAGKYASGSQTEPVLAGAPQNIMLAGPDTIGIGVCTHPYFARTLDQFSNPANMNSAVKIKITGLGSAVAYSDSACTKKIVGDEITLQPSTTIWGTDGGPSSDVPFYLIESKSENLTLTAIVPEGGLPFAYGVDVWSSSLANPGNPPVLPQTTVSLLDLRASVSCSASGVICIHDSGNPITNGTNLQNAINSAQPGNVIVLDAGVTYTASLLLPPGFSNNPKGEYVTITTSKLAKIPAPGIRVTPANASSMARIQAAIGNPDYAVEPTTGTMNVLPSSYFRFLGLEITIDPAATLQYDIMNLETNVNSKNWPTQQSDLPNHIFVESSYVHGNPTASVQEGIILGGVYEAIVDSYISDCHVVGEDAQAITGRGGKTLLIQNNYLEGSGENIIYGGALAYYPNAITTDLSIIKNTFSKPLSWYDNRATDPNSQFVCVVTKGNPCAHWTVKNLLEFKEGRRILVDGNTFTNLWVDGQTGFPLLITPQGDGQNYFIIVEDVTYTNNIIKHSMNGLDFTQQSPVAPAHSQLTQRVLFQNNVGWDIGDPFWGKYVFSVLLESQGFDGLTLDHNTMGFSNSGEFWDTSPNPVFPPNGIQITNNIVTGGKYCFHATPPGWSGFLNLTINNNAFIGCSASEMPPQATNGFFPADPAAVDFTSWSADAWNADGDVLSLKSSASPYFKDDLGADWAVVKEHAE